MNGSKDPGDEEDHSVDDICVSSTIASFHALLRDGKYSDVTIVCGNREFKTHRAVVCAQSLWFEQAFTTPPKKRTVRSVELKGVDPDIFQRFLEFLYTGTYTLDNEANTASSNTEEIKAMLGNYPRCPIAISTIEVSTEEMDVDTPKRPVRRSNRLNSTAEPSDDTTDSESLPPIEASSETSLPLEMTISLALYQLAVTYSVPALQLLARDRFYVAAKERWLTSWEGSSYEDTQEFEDVVLDIYTLQDDEPMWKTLCKLIKMKAGEDVMRERMQHVLKEHEDLRTGVGNYMLQWGADET